MPEIQVETKLSDADLESIIAGVVARIKPHLDARPALVDGDAMSRIAGISEATLDRLRRADRIPSVKLGSRRLYNPDHVIRALEAGNGEGAAHE